MMPKFGDFGHLSPQQILHRQMLDDAPNLCYSQTYNILYDKLRKEGKLERFIAIIQHCSIKGIDINATRDALISSFPGYIDGNDLTVDCLVNMIKSYSDIGVAWGFGAIGDDVSNIMVKNRAFNLAMNTSDIKDLVLYRQVFGGGSDDSGAVKESITTVNFNLRKK